MTMKTMMEHDELNKDEIKLVEYLLKEKTKSLKNIIILKKVSDKILNKLKNQIMKQELLKIGNDIVAELIFWTDLSEEDWNKKWEELLKKKGFEKKGDLYYRGKEVLTYDSKIYTELGNETLACNYKLSHIQFYSSKDKFDKKDLDGNEFKKLQELISKVEGEKVEMTFNDFDF